MVAEMTNTIRLTAAQALVRYLAALRVVNAHDGFQKLRVSAVNLCHVGQGFHVFGEAVIQYQPRRADHRSRGCFQAVNCRLYILVLNLTDSKGSISRLA